MPPNIIFPRASAKILSIDGVGLSRPFFGARLSCPMSAPLFLVMRFVLKNKIKKSKDGISPHWSRDSVGSKRYSMHRAVFFQGDFWDTWKQLTDCTVIFLNNAGPWFKAVRGYSGRRNYGSARTYIFTNASCTQTTSTKLLAAVR